MAAQDKSFSLTEWLIAGLLAGALIGAGVLFGWTLRAPKQTSAPAEAETGIPKLSFSPLPKPGQKLTRIGFGSCARQFQRQPIWDAIIRDRNDLFLMLGDNVYGDVSSDEMWELELAYRNLAAHPDFSRARAAVPMLATWDDHDYGGNDAGANFPHRAAAAELFRAFWQAPDAVQPDGGIYRAKIFGPVGSRVQIILLDTRSFRSDLLQGEAEGRRKPHIPDSSANKTMLGETQWQWLAAQLRQSADVRLIVSSIQVLADAHTFERWGNLPAERERLFQTIRKTNARGVVMLSGDRHFGALYRSDTALNYPLIEVTSSSLNAPFMAANEQEPQMLETLFAPENYGFVDIDWTARSVVTGLKDIDGRVVRSVQIGLAELGVL